VSLFHLHPHVRLAAFPAKDLMHQQAEGYVRAVSDQILPRQFAWADPALRTVPVTGGNQRHDRVLHQQARFQIRVRERHVRYPQVGLPGDQPPQHVDRNPRGAAEAA